MNRIGVWFALFVVFVVVESGDSTWNIKDHLATKTMYTPKSVFTSAPESCSPVQINLVARHGARYPTSSDIKKFSDLQIKMEQYSSLYGPEYAWMGTWKNPYKPQEAGELTYSGQVEHYNLAQRMRWEYPVPMSQPYQPYTYQMQSSHVSRTSRSGSSFGYSLFNNQTNGILPYPGGSFAPFYLYSESLDQDVQLRFFDVCPTYTSFVDDNATATEQATIYKQNDVANAGIQLAKMIDVFPSWNITADEINMMYKGCGFDIAVFNKTNEFCMLFNEESGDVLEYYNDLQDYYQKGYGYPINYEIACLLLQDIISIHQDYVSGENTDLKAKFRFAHAETVMPLVAILGLYKDSTPLMADWTEEQKTNRQWKSSIISPFAANVQFILYDCDGSFMIKVLVNEVEQILPCCDDIYCDFDQVVNCFSSQLACNYQSWCYDGETFCEYYCM